jgi:hypothetical protein
MLKSGVQKDLAITSDGLHQLLSVTMEAPSQAPAEKLVLSADLVDAHGKTDNSWNLWVFPTNTLSEERHKLRFSGVDGLRKIYPWALQPAPKLNPADTDLLVTTNLDRETRDYLNAGGRVILLEPGPAFQTEYTRFRLASWDGGGPSGTILDRSHPALRQTPSDGWCDLQFYSLIEGSRAVFLDPLPVKVEPLVRCIDRPTRLANRAYLFELSVGRGKLLVSSFRFEKAITANDPGAIFLFDRLVRYALGPDFKPRASVSEEALTGSAAK